MGEILHTYGNFVYIYGYYKNINDLAMSTAHS